MTKSEVRMTIEARMKEKSELAIRVSGFNRHSELVIRNWTVL
jgi:hypothetical protein